MEKKSVACGNVPLPVELTHFQAQTRDNKHINLSWHTASETNNSHFLVQRRQKNSIWHNIASISGHGTSIEPQTYSYIDKSVPDQSKVFYYRLKQVDYDGSWKLSKVISINSTARQKEKGQNIIFIRTVGDNFKLIYNKETKEKILKPLNSD